MSGNTTLGEIRTLKGVARKNCTCREIFSGNTGFAASDHRYIERSTVYIASSRNMQI